MRKDLLDLQNYYHSSLDTLFCESPCIENKVKGNVMFNATNIESKIHRGRTYIYRERQDDVIGANGVS